ncbi:MAG: TraB/GumN family protein [Flavobacteriales bacterium]|nr:TraB/GumN family protein [Flavobacteriales bacterium]
MKKLSLLIWANLFILSVVAQDLEKSLLWKIEKDGTKPSYLFGTIHVLPQEDFKLDEKVKKAFGESEELTMEMDLTDPALQTKMFQGMNMADGMTLDKLLSKEDYDALSKKVASIEGTPPFAMMNAFKPFMVATIMMSEYVGSQPASFEMALMTMANENEMSVSGLESIEYQMAVFDSIPYESQAEDLMEMVYEADKMKALFSRMVQEYKDEEVNALFTSISEYSGSESEMEFLLYKRNANWVDKLGDMLGEKTYFIGVGAGHLGGQKGVIKLLRDKGYSVTAILD